MVSPFRTITKDEQKRIDIQKKEIADRVKLIAEAGQAILSSAEGQKYRQVLEAQKDSLVRIMIRTVDPDPVRDAFFCRAILNQLSVLYRLLEDIKIDARR